ncbi:MAG: flagellar protein FlgN [Defluviitaleaceae bacterium]|nr:flagellar protein FlgN [Defluviitaleaceae bacterium]
MASLVSNLIDVLKGQAELYNQVAALSARKKEFIIKNDIENLRETVSEENAIIPKIIRTDKEREKIMKDICSVLNKNEAELTISHLATLMENQPENDRLIVALEEAKTAAGEMKKLNEENKALVQQALEYIDYNINVIHSSLSEVPAGYNATLEDAADGTSFLDING